MLQAQQQNEVLRQDFGQLELFIQAVEGNSDIVLSENESAIIISKGADLASLMAQNAIKYSGPSRIYLSDSRYEPQRAILFMSMPEITFRFIPEKAGTSQELIVSGIPDFRHAKLSYPFEANKVYELVISINRYPQESFSEGVESYLFDSSASSYENLPAQKSKKKRFSFIKRWASNRYVRWGAAAVLLSAGGYFGYTQFLQKDDSGLPLPPAPPTEGISVGGQ